MSSLSGLLHRGRSYSNYHATGTDPPTGTVIQRCGDNGQRWALCPPRVLPSYREIIPSAGPSDLCFSLVNMPVISESSPGMYRRDDVSEVVSNAPFPEQIGVCPQFDHMPDHGPPKRQQKDVGQAQDRATHVPAAVILPHSINGGNALLYREEGFPIHHGHVVQSPQHLRITPM